jgi:hypothetical protein
MDKCEDKYQWNNIKIIFMTLIKNYKVSLNMMWKILHTMSVYYFPHDDEKNELAQFLNHLYFYIRCKKCKLHYILYIKEINLQNVCENRNTLFEFFVNLHNSVNIKLNKSIMTIEEAKQNYFVNAPKLLLQLKKYYKI